MDNNDNLSGWVSAQARAATKYACRNYYDIQSLRQLAESRIPKKKSKIDLDPVDLAFFKKKTKDLKALEQEVYQEILHKVRKHPLWKPFFLPIRGVAQGMAGVMLTEFDPNKARHVSSFWKFAGLHVDGAVAPGPGLPPVGGYAPKPVKGQKLAYNKDLRRCLLGICSTNIIRACIRTTAEGESVLLSKKGKKVKGFRPYAVYEVGTRIDTEKEAEKLRKQGGDVREEKAKYWKKTAGKPVLTDTIDLVLVERKQYWIPKKEQEARYIKIYLDRKHRAQCAGWGNNRGHRDQHARRVMMKQLVADLWVAWRTELGLEVSEPYSVAKLGLSAH